MKAVTAEGGHGMSSILLVSTHGVGGGYRWRWTASRRQCLSGQLSYRGYGTAKSMVADGVARHRECESGARRNAITGGGVRPRAMSMRRRELSV